MNATPQKDKYKPCTQTLKDAEKALVKIEDSIAQKGIKKAKVAEEAKITSQHFSRVLRRKAPLTAEVKEACYKFLNLV